MHSRRKLRRPRDFNTAKATNHQQPPTTDCRVPQRSAQQLGGPLDAGRTAAFCQSSAFSNHCGSVVKSYARLYSACRDVPCDCDCDT